MFLSLSEQIKKSKKVTDQDIKDILNINVESNYYKEALIAKNDQDRIKNIDKLFNNSFELSNILCMLENDNLKIKFINYVLEENHKIKVLNTVRDDNLILLYYFNSDLEDDKSKYNIINCIKNPLLKENYAFSELCYFSQLNILKSISDDRLLAYALLHPDDYNDILPLFNDENHILKFFNKLNGYNEYDKEMMIFELLQYLPDNVFKDKLVRSLNKDNNKQYLFNNLERNYLMSEYNINCKEKIDTDLKFRIVINCENENLNEPEKQGTILKRWKAIKMVDEIKNQFEITSPVFILNKNFLNELFYVCEIIDKNKFKKSSINGLEIFMSYDYFETKEQLNNFINLVGNCIYPINCMINSNHHNNKRSLLNINHRKLIELFPLLTLQNDKTKSYNEYKNIISTSFDINRKDVCFDDNRYKNTIKFETNSAQISYADISKTLIFIAKLAESAKYKNINKILDKNQNCDDLANNLINMMFDNEKDYYLNRYNNNKIEEETLKIKNNFKI